MPYIAEHVGCPLFPRMLAYRGGEAFAGLTQETGLLGRLASPILTIDFNVVGYVVLIAKAVLEQFERYHYGMSWLGREGAGILLSRSLVSRC